MSSVRAFLAVPLPEHLKESIRATQKASAGQDTGRTLDPP